MGTQTIQQLLAPVVMISACGLLCLALYNRLATIVARVRQFNRERLEDMLRVRGAPETVRRKLETHREGLEAQVPGMLARARLIHRALLCLGGCIACMLGCSLTIGLSLSVTEAGWAAVALFVVGIASMLVGVLFAMAELRKSLRQVEFEHELMERLEEPKDAEPDRQEK